MTQHGGAHGMSRGTIKTLVFVVLLAALAADISVGCGQGYVYGPVAQKIATNGDKASYLLQINGDSYEVPGDFYQTVRLGDTVKYNGKTWTIVKRAGTLVSP